MASQQQIRRTIDAECHRVYTLAFYTLGSHQDAEDATQEVLTRYWQHAADVDPDRVQGWLVRVTTNVCRDLLRKRARLREDVATEATELALGAMPSGDPGPTTRVESEEIGTQIEQQLAEMNEPYRSLLILREIQGLSYQAIGAALELPLSTVRVYLHRGRRKLAERLRRFALPDAEDRRLQPTASAVGCRHED
ncbi:MAG: sigma-70 family RNA polymerase sigma factor [Planctomycetota bacterium]